MPAIKIPERAESDLQKAELLAKCFFTVSSNENLGANEINRRHKTLKILESESSINNMDDRSINADITINEVTNAIKSKTNSAAGPDILNYEILKNIPISTIIIVTELFNMIWRSGDIPLAWKVATVIPILKDGKEPHDSNSYRPIALTSHIGKILETIVKDRLQFMLEKNKLISNTQSGFRKSHCTMDQIMKLENDVKQGFKKKEKTVAVFLDVSKAYDECWRDGALYKIKEIGIKGRALSYLKNFLIDRFFKVQINNAKSSLYKQENGIPQGAVISPLIFTIMVNDVQKEFKDKRNKLSQYADDIAIWRTSLNVQYIYKMLQIQIDAITNWMIMWGFRLNAEKTVGIVFSRGGKVKFPEIEITIKGKMITTATNTKFLGMILDQRMNWKLHIDNLVERCRGLINIMRYMKGTGWGASTSSLLMFYKSFIRGKIDYGSVIYDTAAKRNTVKIDRIQNMALRTITYTPQSTSSEALEVILGVPPLELRRQELRLNSAISALADEDHPAHTAFINNDTRTADNKNKFKYYPSGWKTSDCIQENDKLRNAFMNMQNNKPNKPPWEFIHPDYNTELNEKFLKDEISINMVNEYIQRIKENGVTVYTDGSKDEHGKIGIGIYVPKLQVSINHKLPDNLSIFTAEMMAILTALEKISENPPKMVTIFTDSLSSIQALRRPSQCNRPDIAEKILCTSTNLHGSGCKVKLAWIPSHLGIKGNEKADKEANKGRNSLSKIEVGVTKTEIKSTIKEFINEQWIDKWKNSTNGRIAFLLFKMPSRKDQIKEILKIPMNRKLLKLRVGRGRFLIDDPICFTCMLTNSIPHIFECELHNEKRKELDQYCKLNNIPMSFETLLNNELDTETKRLVKHFLNRINLDI
jgi:ribonuclease HI